MIFKWLALIVVFLGVQCVSIAIYCLAATLFVYVFDAISGTSYFSLNFNLALGVVLWMAQLIYRILYKFLYETR